MSVDLGSAHGKIELDGRGARAGVNEASTALNSLDKSSQVVAKQLAQVGTSIANTGRSLTTHVTLPIVGVAAASAKMAIDFDREMRNVSSISTAVRKDFDKWNEKVLELSTKVPQSAAVLAKGLYEIASSGFDGSDAMLILEASAKAAAAGLTDTNIAADAATTVLNAWGMKAQDVGKVQDIMFQTVKLGKLTYEQLASSLSTVASTAAAANVPFEQVAAAYATMTKAGITADEAAVALNQTLLSYISPSKEALEAAGKLGLELSATALSTKGLDGVIGDLVSKLGTSSAELDKLTKSGKSEAEIQQMLAQRAGLTVEQFGALFGNVRALKGILSLTREEGKVFASDLDAMKNSTGAAADAYGEMSKSIALQMDLMQSSVSKAMIQIGNTMAPVIGQLAGLIGQAADAFGKLDPSIKTIIVVVGLAVAAIGPLLWMVGSLVTAVGAIIPIFGTVIAPILAVVAVVAALAAIFIYAYKHSEQFREIVHSAFNAIKNVISTVVSEVVKFVGSQLAVLSKFWKENGDQIVQAVTNALNIIRAVFNFVLPAVLFIVRSVWGNIKGVISGALDIIMGLIKIFAGVFTGDWKKVWEGVKQVLGGAVKLIWNLIQLTFMGRILKLGGTFVSLFRGVFAKGIPTVLKAITSPFTKLPKTMANIGTNIVKGIFNGIIRMASWIARQVANFIQRNIVRPIKAALRISSPSKVFMEIGGNISRGLSLGIDSKMPKLPFSELTPKTVNSQLSFDGGAGDKTVNLNLYFTGSLSIRSDNDIQTLAKELYSHVQSAERGQGQGRVIGG